MVRGKFVSSTMQTSANKISRLWGAIIIFVFFFNKSLSNLEILLILRSFFQWCRRGFSLTCSCQKLKKHVERSISFILTHHSKWKKRLSTCPRQQTLKLGSQTSETSPDLPTSSQRSLNLTVYSFVSRLWYIYPFHHCEYLLKPM